MSTLLRDVEIDGRRLDVRVTDSLVTDIGPGLPASKRDAVIACDGGALLPGLHDHHLHLLATAAAEHSVDLSRAADLRSKLLGATGDRVRAVGYHESLAGSLDRYALDRLEPRRPVRIQHRSGGLWMLNTAALAEIDLDDSPDVERDSTGTPTGRLWRYDARLREKTGSPLLDSTALKHLGHMLASYGLTSVTDATPDLDPNAVELLRLLPQHVTLLGANGVLPAGMRHGPRKLLLRDHDLPTFSQLAETVQAARSEDRAVAVHCVTRTSLLLTLAVLAEVGRRPGDRIEHAAVVPDPLMLTGLRVVTQPGFVATRGDDYLREVDADDRPHLYRYASLLDAGVDVVASSDAPYGPLDPWAVIRAARDRVTPEGKVLGTSERVDAWTTLRGYLSRPHVLAGTRADLCLLHTSLREALADPTAALVRETWISGHPQSHP